MDISPTNDGTGTHGPGLFLSEFVVEVGPLRRRPGKDFLDEGEDNILGRSNERNSSGFSGVPLSGQNTNDLVSRAKIRPYPVSHGSQLF